MSWHSRGYFISSFHGEPGGIQYRSTKNQCSWSGGSNSDQRKISVVDQGDPIQIKDQIIVVDQGESKTDQRKIISVDQEGSNTDQRQFIVVDQGGAYTDQQ